MKLSLNKTLTLRKSICARQKTLIQESLKMCRLKMLQDNINLPNQNVNYKIYWKDQNLILNQSL